MNEFTPDAIAQLATRLYNEVPGANVVPKTETDAPVAPGRAGRTWLAGLRVRRQASSVTPADVAVRFHERVTDGLRAFIQGIRIGPSPCRTRVFAPARIGTTRGTARCERRPLRWRGASARCAGHSPRFPGAQPARARQAAGLARQRRHDAEAAERHRRVVELLRPRQLEHPPRRPHAGGPRDRRLRAGASKGADTSGGVLDQGNHLRPRDDRGDQPRRPDLRPQVLAAGRRDRALHARASCQHRSLADDRQGKRGGAEGHPRDRPRRDHAGRVSDAAGSADEARRADPRVQQRGHALAGRRNDADGQALRRPRVDRRGTDRRARSRERASARLAISMSSPATRFSLRPGSGPSLPRRNCSTSCRPGRAAAA